MAITIDGSTGWTYADDIKQKFGTGDDLEIYHDGSHSRIKDTGTGYLIINTDTGVLIKNGADDEGIAYFTPNGAVELMYDNSKKFETTNLGAQITGELTLTSHLKMGDGDVIAIGDSEDLKLYHDGTNSYIQSQQGELKIQGATGKIRLKPKDTEQSIVCHPNGGVDIYYDNTKHFDTNASGVTVFGGDGSGRILPGTNNAGYIGDSSNKWNAVYAATGTIQTSDKNEKNTIVDTDLGLSFVNKLKPVSYKFNIGTRTHYGLIAQDVETILSDISKPTTGFAGFIKEDIPDKLYVEEDEIPEGKKVGDIKTAAYTTYGLRYNEFISPLIKAVQELSAEVETLKTKVAALEAK